MVDVTYLIKAQAHWMESVNPGVRNQWPQYKKDAFLARLTKGDIERVELATFIWGNAEGPPDYIRVTVTQMASLAVAQSYIEQLDALPDGEGNSALVRRKRYGVPESYVDDVLSEGGLRTVAWADIESTVIDYLN